ncbi:MAG: DUF1850 domain-containing protein [Syntrophaceae bacterium]|nr:DUF1850 domain-containing protein [Syntrophaceae bacterium]
MGKGIVLISVVAGLGAFLFFFPVGVLSLSLGDETVVFLRKVKSGDTFQLAYLHSVARSDVRELFVIDSQYRLVLVETRFQGQGTGLPYNLAEGEKLRREGDWFRITGMRRVFPSIFWRVQSQWQNRFRFREETEIDLSATMGNGLIRIEAREMNYLSWMAMFFRKMIF